MKKRKYNEADIAEVLVDYLESKDWDVYQEVQFHNYGGIADIVAVKDDELWIIETKTSLTFSVMAQAESWQSHYRSVAVPRTIQRDSKGRHLAYRICRHYLRIGVIEISPAYSDVFIIVAPALQNIDKRSIERKLDILSPLHKEYAKAGSSGSGHLTPFKYTLLQIKEFIEENSGCTMNDIIEHIGKGHYSSESSAKNNLRTSLRDWVDWCIVKWDVDKRANVYKLRENENQSIDTITK